MGTGAGGNDKVDCIFECTDCGAPAIGCGNGYIKPLPFRDIDYLPVTCSHTHHTVNIAEIGAGDNSLCDEEKIEEAMRVKCW